MLSIISAKRLYSLRYESESRSTDPGLTTTQQSFEMFEAASARNNRVMSQPPEKPKRTTSRKSTTISADRRIKNTRSSSGSDTIPAFVANHSGDIKTTLQPLEVHVEKTVILTTEEAPRPRTAQSAVARTFSPTHGSPPDSSGLSKSPQRQALESLAQFEVLPPVDSPSFSDIAFSPPASSTKLLFSPSTPRASQIIDFDALYLEKNGVDKIPLWEDTEYHEEFLVSSSGRQPEAASKHSKRTVSGNLAKRVSLGTRHASKIIHSRKLTGAYRRMVLLQM